MIFEGRFMTICAKCQALTEWYIKQHPESKHGYVMCKECIEANEIVLVDLPYNPEPPK